MPNHIEEQRVQIEGVGTGEPPDDDIPEYRGPKAVVPHGREASDIERRKMVGGLLKPVAPVNEILQAQNDLRALIAETLQEGRDYGKVPGAERPFLYKAGAERINVAYGIVATFELIEREVDHDVERSWQKRKKVWFDKPGGGRGSRFEETSGTARGLYRYAFKCVLLDRATGIPVGEGVGSCSSLESKYCDRPHDVENTILKMGKKRSYVDATLTTFGLSDQFSQDEDVVKARKEAEGDDAPEQQQGWDADDAIGWGKHGALTWRECCEQEPGWIDWAIGRKNGQRVNKISADEAKKIGALLDEVQGKAAQGDRERGEHRPDPGAPAAVEPLNAVVLTGKHRGITWGDLIKRERGYVEEALAKGWAKLDKPESAALCQAIREELALSGALDRALQEGAPERGLPIGAPAGPHETRFHALMREAGVSVDRWKVIGEAHDKLPDHPTDWLEDDYRVALLSVDQFGVADTLERCDRRLRNRKGKQPTEKSEQPDPPPLRIDSKLRTKAEQMLASAERNRVASLSNFTAGVAQCLQDDNDVGLRELLDELEPLIYAAAGMKAPKQGDLLR